MIEANELRRGNLIYGVSDREETVDAILGNNSIKSYPGRLIEAKLDAELKYCSPIPLTEEWLLKLGFEPYSDHSPFGFKNYRNHILFGVSMAGSQCQPVAEIGDYVVGDNYKVIKSVHQLQNYYYAITGQELTP